MDYGGRVDLISEPASLEGFIGGILALVALFVVLPFMLYLWDKLKN
ncbi:hypothetical protein [Planococcus sp. CAU13]|nr:hypothetical protein [Planococcus sp. CAU13]